MAGLPEQRLCDRRAGGAGRPADADVPVRACRLLVGCLLCAGRCEHAGRMCRQAVAAAGAGAGRITVLYSSRRCAGQEEGGCNFRACPAELSRANTASRCFEGPAPCRHVCATRSQRRTYWLMTNTLGVLALVRSDSHAPFLAPHPPLHPVSSFPPGAPLTPYATALCTTHAHPRLPKSTCLCRRPCTRSAAYCAWRRAFGAEYELCVGRAVAAWARVKAWLAEHCPKVCWGGAAAGADRKSVV